MSECYHAYCDTAALNETVPFANIFFLKKTTQVIFDLRKLITFTI
jgi:hypothetical protein